MFRSVLAAEMMSFLELRRATVSLQQLVSEKSTLMLLDNHLIEYDYCKKCLSEEILLTWIQTLPGKSKTVNSKIVFVRNFVKYLNTMGNRLFALLPAPCAVRA
jgi:hypothetical protein